MSYICIFAIKLSEALSNMSDVIHYTIVVKKVIFR